MHIDIPDAEVWAACGTVLLISAGSFIRFIRWQKDVMTKKEHADICNKRETAASEAFSAISVTLQRQDDKSSEWRNRFDEKMDTNHGQNRGDIEEIKGTVAAVKTDVEVLKTRINMLQPGTTVNIQGGG